MANPNVILQWNCRGLLSNRIELENLISEFSPAVICLQETLLDPSIQNNQNNENNLPSFVKFKNYKGYFKCINSGRNGVAIYVKNNVPHSIIELDTVLQALAVRVTYQNKEFIVSNHYTSLTHDGVPSKHKFNKIIHFFDRPYLMCGDFNAHNKLWSHKDDDRGRALGSFICDNDLGVLNTKVKTRQDHSGEWSLLDLTIAHPSLLLDFESKVLPDAHGSDHCPILVTLNGPLFENEKRPRWNFKKADWNNFRTQCRNEINTEFFDPKNDTIETFTDKLIEIATENIPMTSPFFKKCSKPWFDDECKAAKRERSKANQLLRRYPCINNAMRVRIANARAKRTFKKKKRECWKKYVSSVNSRTPSKKVWNMIRKITGKNIPSHVLHLKDPFTGELITNKEDIANKIGATFEENSSSNNYSNEFQTIKRIEEEKPLNFTTKSKHESYNKKFKLRDLKRSLKRSKDSSPGPDNIHYQILKNLPEVSLKILLDIINRYWDTQTFPESWREALLLPIPKPGKDPQNPNNFRPIALTSCICKTVERMVNERLIHYLEKKNILTKFQAGFRSERSTIDQLVRLDTFIRNAFINGDHVVGVFFDLTKAYDTTWKYGIMKDLHAMGLRGSLPIFIQNFLSERTFNILLGATVYAQQFSQEEGVPQGAILSTTLFNVKLNKIAQAMTNGVECSLYVDDFIIFIRSSTVEGIERQLQLCINSIVRWTRKNGFTVSSNKTVAMHFCNRNSKYCRDPILNLGKEKIKFVTEHKFLGLIWDSKLTFESHIQYLKKKCANAMNVIKVLSYSNWGSDTKTLLSIFRSLVRSKLDYGCFIYCKAKKQSLECLNILHRQGLRLCLGAFKSSPIESLYVEADEPPLEIRWKYLAMRYALKIGANKNNPTFDSIFKRPYRHLFENSTALPLGESIHRYFREAGISKSKIEPSRIPDFPLYQSEENDVSFKLAQYDKKSTLPEFFRFKFLTEILPEYQNYLPIYTDGSKLNEKASYSVYFPSFGNISHRISDDSGIFTAEVEAINKALSYIKISPRSDRRFVIFCDSKSVLESIESQETKIPCMIRLLDTLQELKKNSVVKFCWVPSHVGIPGNETADILAKNALNIIEPIPTKIPYSDFIPKVKTYIRNLWQERYTHCHQNIRPIKLYHINPNIRPFSIKSLSRKDEVIIHRIRIGHTRITHSYLMEGIHIDNIPNCPFCHFFGSLTVKHLLLDCPHFEGNRRKFYSGARNMKDLFERFPLKRILDFLKDTYLYHQI